MKAKVSIQHRRGESTPQAKGLIVGPQCNNPIKPRADQILPFASLVVGESLFFHRKEMLNWHVTHAKSAAIRYNRVYGDLFGFWEHTGDNPMLEIVRIK